MAKKGRIFIGTSNVVVPGNKTSFPPDFRSKSRLHYYASIFDSVEINSSFYKIPLARTYERWTAEVPDDFRFSLKLSKEVTHIKDLKGDLSVIEKFMQSAKAIGKKKGCLLIQFPGKITLDYYEKVETILQQIQSHDPDNEWNKAVEFRSNTWYTGETRDLLNEFGATMVLHDIPKSKNSEVYGKANFIYQRFHGPKGDYRDSYSDQFLKDRATEIKNWSKQGKEVYIYFNNTIGSAYENAIDLKDLLKK
ncbi:MAG: DUF72 domain-containing protein [Citrobacter freundii]|nr:MAG: DUF72 domain-containing protein [Citrobacter freundii]